VPERQRESVKTINARSFLSGRQSVKKYYFNFYASCGSTHKIEFAEQIHKKSGRVPDFLYKGRKNVPAGRGFSSVFARKRGFEREAARKTKFFDSLTPAHF
jgi:ribosomal protein L13E